VKTLRATTLVIVAGWMLLAGCRSMLSGDEAGTPLTVRAELDRDYPNWRLHRVDPDALRFLRSNSPSDTPTIARGDFNGDGTEDVGLLIDHETGCLLIIAHRIGGSDQYSIVHFPADNADYILVSRKGKMGYDHNTGKGFTFPLDSVEVNWFEKAARAYVFKDGTYCVAQTSD
jgi:hypothetical protein